MVIIFSYSRFPVVGGGCLVGVGGGQQFQVAFVRGQE